MLKVKKIFQCNWTFLLFPRAMMLSTGDFTSNQHSFEAVRGSLLTPMRNTFIITVWYCEISKNRAAT